jgi:hypothetical protein
MKKYYIESRRRGISYLQIKRMADLIGHMLHRNCPLKHVNEEMIEGRVEVTGRRERRRKELLDDLKEKRGYWKLKEKALDSTLWRIRFGRGLWTYR